MSPFALVPHHARAWLLMVLAVCCFGLGDSHAQEEQNFLILDSAEFVVSRSTSPPGDDAPWQPVRLPDDWNQSRPGFNGAVWYRIRFEVVNPRQMRTTYIPRITGRNMRWFINGTSVGSTTGSVDTRTADSYRPFQRGVVPALQRPGENVIHIQVIGEAAYRHGLTTVTVGVAGMVARVLLRQDLQVTAVVVFGAVLLFAACVCFAIWLGSRKDPALLWSALTGLALALWALEFGWPVTMALAKLQDLVLYVVRYLYVPPLLVLCLEAAARRNRRLEWAIWSAFGLGALAAVATSERSFPSVLTAASLTALCLEVWMVALLASSPQARGRWPSRLLALAMLVLALLTAHDWARWMGYVDYENMLLAPYATPFIMAAMGAAIVSRYLSTLGELEQANAVLGTRIEEKVHEAQAAQQRMNEALHLQAVMRERQRIMSDMHDGIGADLVALLGIAQNPGTQSQEVSRRIAQLLLDLRVIVDSLEPVEGDLGVVLGNVRYRMRAAIEQSGIRFNWRVESLPVIPELTPEKVLAIQRVVMEALSNSLQHSGASSITVAARHDTESGVVRISIEDDGQGFEVQRVGPGRGLRTMRSRVQQTGIQVSIESTPGQGTRVDLVFSVQEPGKTSMPAAAGV